MRRRLTLSTVSAPVFAGLTRSQKLGAFRQRSIFLRTSVLHRREIGRGDLCASAALRRLAANFAAIAFMLLPFFARCAANLPRGTPH